MIRFISLNIEGDKHFDTIMPFFEREQPDVLCVQELFEEDIPAITDATGMTLAAFCPMLKRSSFYTDGPKDKILGVAIFSRLPFVPRANVYYVGSEKDIPELVVRNSFIEANTTNLGIASAEIAKEGEQYIIATTHFTWTPSGSVTDYQLADLDKLFAVLDTFPGFVLAGDFNAPRGKEAFSRIAARYTDNIPQQYMTSVDQKLHRVSGLMYMIDGLFTTPEYAASNVRLQDGVSDHMAILADISRKA